VPRFPCRIHRLRSWPARRDSYQILDTWYPKNWKACCVEGQVNGDEAWWKDAMEFAAAKRMMPLGTVHSHTYRKRATEFDEVPSLGDLASWEELDRITGIANVTELDSGKKKCGDPVFHGPPNNCEVTVK
jgi:hypothetical protein